MKTRIRSSFRVYHTASYHYLRFVLIGAPLLCCYLANETKQYWMYCIAVVIAFIAVYVITLVDAKVILDPKGITLIQTFHHTDIPWDSIVFSEIIALLPYGFSLPVEIICFSTQRHNPSSIRNSKSLPRLSKDFVFIILNDQVRNAIAEQIPGDVAKRLRIDLKAEDDHRDIYQPSVRYKWMALCLSYFFALLAAYLLIKLS